MQDEPFDETSPNEPEAPRTGKSGALERKAAALAARKAQQKAMAKAYREKLKASPSYQAKVAAAKEKARTARRAAYEAQKEKQRAQKAALKEAAAAEKRDARAAKEDALKRTLRPGSALDAREDGASASGKARPVRPKAVERPRRPSAPDVRDPLPPETPRRSVQEEGRAVDEALSQRLADIRARRAHLSLVRDAGDDSSKT